MRSLSVQIQPARAPGIDLAHVERLFDALAARRDLVAHHNFESGDDQGRYYNFTFGTPAPSFLWKQMWESIYESPVVGAQMKRASMAMCSSEQGWDSYALLYHFDPEVPREAL
jgi:hypothetical protein